jgi:hypothetical protein
MEWWEREEEQDLAEDNRAVQEAKTGHWRAGQNGYPNVLYAGDI